MTEFFRKNKLALAGSIIVAALTLAAIFAPWLAPYDPAAQTLPERLVGPSWNHPLGNDELGRDILSRILLVGKCRRRQRHSAWKAAAARRICADRTGWRSP